MLTLRKEIAIAVIVISSLVAVVFAASTLFTQNFPTVASQTVLVANCGTGATTNKLTANPAGPIPTGSGPGTILFNCGSTTSAITAQAAGTVTTTGWTIPSGMTLSLVTFVSGATTCSGGTAITVGGTVVFGGTGLVLGSYDYCLAYTIFPASGVPAFSITWQQ